MGDDIVEGRGGYGNSFEEGSGERGSKMNLMFMGGVCVYVDSMQECHISFLHFQVENSLYLDVIFINDYRYFKDKATW
jgi:hypothetical protein